MPCTFSPPHDWHKPATSEGKTGQAGTRHPRAQQWHDFLEKVRIALEVCETCAKDKSNSCGKRAELYRDIRTRAYAAERLAATETPERGTPAREQWPTAERFNELEKIIDWSLPISPDEIYKFAESYAAWMEVVAQPGSITAAPEPSQVALAHSAYISNSGHIAGVSDKVNLRENTTLAPLSKTDDGREGYVTEDWRLMDNLWPRAQWIHDAAREICDGIFARQPRDAAQIIAKHMRWAAHREICPQCKTAVLGYCAQGVYCTDAKCRYAY